MDTPELITDPSLRERFEKKEEGEQEEVKLTRVPSTAREARDERLDQILLPDSERGKMPFTKSAYLKKENPQRVQWEREIRKFLRQLSPEHEHRIAAVHVYEWATGKRLADLMAAEKAGDTSQTKWRGDLRKINALLREYFGKPYMTYIMGRKVPNAFKVPKGFYITRRVPKTLTVYAEYAEGIRP